MSEAADSDSTVTITETSPWRSEDIWAMCLAALVLIVALAATWSARPADYEERLTRYEKLNRKVNELESSDSPDKDKLKSLRKESDEARAKLAVNPLKPYVGKLGSWNSDPRDAFVDKKGNSVLPGLIGVLVVLTVLYSIGLAGIGQMSRGFPLAFLVVFLLATLSFLLAGQKVIEHFNLEYALWALVVGLIVSNTVGTLALRPAGDPDRVLHQDGAGAAGC